MFILGYSTQGKPAGECRHTDGRRPSLKRYICLICGFVYDEEKGWPQDGIPPGTRWEDVPLNWTCPDCGARKEDFEMVEIE
ncbi:MAG: rubredoxin [Gammaproteobacteria bacterium]|nr:rubredoxin [Gammaproteobacteria bacterium]